MKTKVSLSGKLLLKVCDDLRELGYRPSIVWGKVVYSFNVRDSENLVVIDCGLYSIHVDMITIRLGERIERVYVFSEVFSSYELLKTLGGNGLLPGLEDRLEIRRRDELQKSADRMVKDFDHEI